MALSFSMHYLFITLPIFYVAIQLWRTRHRPMLQGSTLLARLLPETATPVVNGWSMVPSAYKGEGGNFVTLSITSHGRLRTHTDDVFTVEGEGQAGYAFLEPKGVRVADRIQPQVRRLLDMAIHTHFNTVNGQNIHPELAKLDKRFA